MIRLQLGEYRAHKIVLKQRSVDHAAVKMDNVDINAARRVFAARRPTDTTLDTFHILDFDTDPIFSRFGLKLNH